MPVRDMERVGLAVVDSPGDLDDQTNQLDVIGLSGESLAHGMFS